MTARPPIWLVIAWRSLLVIVLGFYFFMIYAIGRGLIPSFGGSPGVILKAAFFTIGMGGFSIWLILYLEVPEMIYSHLLPRLRSKRNRCQACGHPLTGSPSIACCECGKPRDQAPDSYVLSWQTGRSFAVLFVVAIMLGLFTGESWTRIDEARIRQIVSTPQNVNNDRQGNALSFQRQWPANFSKITWSKDRGFECTPVFRARKVRDF